MNFPAGSPGKPHAPALAPELEFVLLCARSELSGAAQARMREVAGGAGFNWMVAARQAVQHGIGPRMYRHLRGSDQVVAPADVVHGLRQAHAAAAANNLARLAEFRAVMDLFDQASLPALPYKGPVLAVEIYGDPTLREFSDLDFLVERADLERARQLLRARGYTRGHDLSPVQEAALLRTGHEDSLCRNDGAVIDLHWQVAKNMFGVRLEAGALRERARTTRVAGRSVPTLSREDLLLVLCVHGSTHAWERLTWICDLAEAVRRSPDLDWQMLRTRAEALRAGRILRLGLHLAHDLLEAPLPGEVEDWIRGDRRIGSLAGRVRRSLFSAEGAAHYLPMQFGLRERFSDRVRLAYSSLFTPTQDDWAHVQIPDRLYSLYYLMRPLRLARKYALGQRSNDG